VQPEGSVAPGRLENALFPYGVAPAQYIAPGSSSQQFAPDYVGEVFPPQAGPSTEIGSLGYVREASPPQTGPSTETGSLGYVREVFPPQTGPSFEIALPPPRLALANDEASTRHAIEGHRLESEPGPGPDAQSDAWHGYGSAEADYCDSAPRRFQTKWYVSVSGLVMARGDEPNKVWVSHEAYSQDNPLMHTQKDLGWRGGGEIRLGRYFGCGPWAIEAAYWTLDPFTSFASQTHPNYVSTPLDFTDVGWANPALPGSPGNLFNVAEEHRVWRRNEVQNIELALIRDRVDHLCSGPFQVGWSAGVRYFRFDEDLRFGSMDLNGLAFGIDPSMEGYLDDKMVNHLVGFQFGSRVDYCRDRWRLYAFPKVGIYNNHIEHRFNAYRGDGELLAPVPAGYSSYPVNSTSSVFSLLTEIDLGLECQFAAKWSATIGYRVTVATGMGLADHQIPFYVADTPDLADIDSNGHLLLHGAYASTTYRF